MIISIEISCPIISKSSFNVDLHFSFKFTIIIDDLDYGISILGPLC